MMEWTVKLFPQYIHQLIEKMKIFLFYKIGDDVGIYNKPVIYAYTSHKELAKKFCQMRNMDLFIEKTENISKNEYNVYTQSLHSRGKELIETALITNGDSYNDIRRIPMVITQHEEEVVCLRTDDVYAEIGKHTNFWSGYFNDELKDALDKLYYFDIMAFSSSMELSLVSFYDESRPLKPCIEIDQLQYFIFHFGSTMKVK